MHVFFKAIAPTGLLAARPVGAWHLQRTLEPVPLSALRLDVASAAVPPVASAGGRFLGRADELAQLTHALGRTRAGQGQVVCISGNAGLGKTRLCAEFAQRCERAGMRVVRVQAHPLSHALPLRPARELLGALCLDCPPDLAPPEARRRIDAALAQASQPSPVNAFLLHELMGVTDDDAPPPAGLPPFRDARQVRLLSLIAQLVRADAASLRLLESIRDGKLTIGDPVASTPTPEPGAYKVRAPRRRGGLPDSSTWGVV